MPKGPFGLPRLTGIGPFVADGGFDNDCNLTKDSRKEVERAREEMIDAGEVLNRKASDIITSAGLSIVGEGVNRVVATAKDSRCVVKIEKMYEPYQNRSEILSYKNLSNEAKQYFLSPMDWSDDYGWVTMTRAEKVGISDEDRRDILKKIILDFGIDMTDFNSENFGYVYGDSMVIDYGTGLRDVDSAPEWDSRQELLDYILKEEGL